MLGRPKRLKPVFMNSLAGPWLNTSVLTVLTIATSSAIEPRWGSSEEICWPLSPHCRNWRRVPNSLASFLMNANRLFST